MYTQRLLRRNEHIRGTTNVAQASEKITERQLNWYGHVVGRDEEHILKKVSRTGIPRGRREYDRKQDGNTHANAT